jgi:hypothetical protein
MFTAVAVLQLAQAHKLGLDDPIGKYLTDYPNKELANRGTIGELLDHTGGTGDTFDATPGHPFGPMYMSHRLELRTLQDYINLYGNRAVRFEPGSRFEYSGYGYILLGRVIEKVSGESYYNYVEEHVFIASRRMSSSSRCGNASGEYWGRGVLDLKVRTLPRRRVSRLSQPGYLRRICQLQFGLRAVSAKPRQVLRPSRAMGKNLVEEVVLGRQSGWAPKRPGKGVGRHVKSPMRFSSSRSSAA